MVQYQTRLKWVFKNLLLLKKAVGPVVDKFNSWNRNSKPQNKADHAYARKL